MNKIPLVQKIISKNTDVDTVAIIPGSNFTYLTGGNFHLMERPTVILITQNNSCFVLPSLEKNSFEELNIDAKVFYWQDKDGYQDAFQKAFSYLGNVKSIGVEGQNIRFIELDAFQKAIPNINIINYHKQLSSLRIAKKQDEIESLQKAINLSEKALTDTIKFVSIGKTELEIKNFLIKSLYDHGTHKIAFDPIVLASTHSALPHGHPSDYKIQHNDALLFDFGGCVNGYNADITRTFFVGAVNDIQKKIYNTVLEANKIGIEKCIKDNTLDLVDDSVLSFLEQSEFKEFIEHKTGHGLGLDIHEEPYVVRGNMQKLIPGMVVTIEPGLYDKKNCGVRIEDDVLITESKALPLTNFPKELTII
jgi:Xaa-Pro dipeptidase